ncbi:hypothetical protein ACFSJ3_06390 [Corallincola platygyrae]|uniref:Uncharacterized protein n=1 Tax=Corallincola platygyrae TaxID=1193278 RepID=A0ABW4XJ99_9GAMM
MATPITKVMWIMSTSTEAGADSEMFVELHIPNLVTAEEQIAGTSGETKIVEIDASGEMMLEEITPSDIELSVDGDTPSSFNAWLPSSCLLLAKGTGTNYQLVCAVPNWPASLWFSADPSDHTDPPAVSGMLTLQNVLDAI